MAEYTDEELAQLSSQDVPTLSEEEYHDFVRRFILTEDSTHQ
jgi:hypothetical protein